MIYCGDWKMWLEASDFADGETVTTFDVGKDSSFTNKCLSTKYYISTLATPRDHYCIYC